MESNHRQTTSPLVICSSHLPPPQEFCCLLARHESISRRRYYLHSKIDVMGAESASAAALVLIFKMASSQEHRGRGVPTHLDEGGCPVKIMRQAPRVHPDGYTVRQVRERLHPAPSALPPQAGASLPGHVTSQTEGQKRLHLPMNALKKCFRSHAFSSLLPFFPDTALKGLTVPSRGLA